MSWAEVMPVIPTAEIIAIGDELLSGETVDTNSAHIDGVLEASGYEVIRHQTVPDAVPAISWAVREAAARADIVLTTGGLGPTQDDLSFEAVADAMGVPLELHEATLARIQARFEKAGRPFSRNNRRQAMVPRGGEVLDNEVGTAPGFCGQLDEAQVFVLPGVPREMRWLLEHRVRPRLKRGVLVTRRTLRVAGIGESQLETDLASVISGHPTVRFGFRTQIGENHVKLMGRGEGAVERVEAARRGVLGVLGPRVFGEDDTTLEVAVVRLLAAARATVATGESCTGGWISKVLTDVPGASSVVLGGVAAYADEVKQRVLGVPADLLERHGAVSEEVAVCLATAVRERFGATFGLSATGIAGPGGGTPHKPVGTVWLALASESATEAWRLPRVPVDRRVIRQATVKSALERLRLRLLRHHSP